MSKEGVCKVLLLYLSVLMSALLATDWVLMKTWNPLTNHIINRVEALQRKAREQQSMLPVKLYKHFVSPATVCKVPCPSLRFLPLIGDSKLLKKFHEYSSCMAEYIHQGQVILMCSGILLCVVTCLVLAIVVCLEPSFRFFFLEDDSGRKEGSSAREERPMKRESMEEHMDDPLEEEKVTETHTYGEDLIATVTEKEKQKATGDEFFLKNKVSFISDKEIKSLERGRVLGRGGFGTVTQVMYKDSTAVVKELLDTDDLLALLREARLMVQLHGAGGVPRVLAICKKPPVMVQEFVGQTYDKFLEKCSIRGFLDSLVSISRLLHEIHIKGVVHNDLKINNITFTRTIPEAMFHVIDFGWACLVGEVAELVSVISSVREVRQARKNMINYEEILSNSYPTGDYGNDSDEDFECKIEDMECDDTEFCEWLWMAPEVKVGQRVMPSGDVYSLGFMIDYVMSTCKHRFLTEPMMQISDMCLLFEPTNRPSILNVAQTIKNLKDQFLPDQLNTKLGYKGCGC